MLILIALFGAFVIVKDLGATLILSVVFLAMFYIVTRATGWVLLALAIVAGGVAVATHVPAITQSPKVTLRLQMWLDPWLNAIPFGDQTARARWAIAAGGLTGRGLGAAPATALPAGHTDLVQAHLTEEMGAVGMIVYIVLLMAIAGQGLWIAAWNRTPERMLLAAGLSIFLISQWFVIFAGTTGLLPLTGVVVPYLSYGKTGMIVFMLTAAMIARLAESGHARESTTELDEVRKGTMATLAGELLLLAGGVVVIFLEAVVWGPATTVRGCVTLLARPARRSLRPHREPPRSAPADHRRPHEARRDPGPQRRDDRGHGPGDGRAHLSARRRHGHADRAGGGDRPAAGMDAGAPARRHAARVSATSTTAPRCGWRRRPTAASASCSW